MMPGMLNDMTLDGIVILAEAHKTALDIIRAAVGLDPEKYDDSALMAGIYFACLTTFGVFESSMVKDMAEKSVPLVQSALSTLGGIVK